MNGSLTATAARAAVLTSAADAITAARVYAGSIADGAIARDRAGTVPYQKQAALDASGLLGITVPAAYGGPDLSPVVLAEVIRAIAAVDPHARQPRPRRLEVSPCRQLPAQRRPPTQPRAALR